MELFRCIKPVGKDYTRFSLLPGWGSPPIRHKYAHSAPPHQSLILSPQKSIQPNKKIKTSFLDVVIAPVYTIFVLISYSFETQIMLILMFSIHKMLLLALKIF